MDIVNVHKRIIEQPKVVVATLLDTLATDGDKVWPNDNWPAIRFKNGLRVGEKGGHGIIRYSVEDYEQGEFVIFRFPKSSGFNGIHKFEIEAINKHTTEVKHSIIMKTEGIAATFKWVVAIRWLHDALIENAFDTLENNYLEVKKHTKWSYWVSFWRFILSRIR